MKSIIVGDSITAVIDGQVYTTCKGQPNYIQFFEAVKKKDEEGVLKAATVKSVVETVSALSVENGKVKFNGRDIPKGLSDILFAILSSGLPLQKGFEQYTGNILKNPSKSAQESIFDFSSYRRLPISEDGCIYAYKGIQSDGYSVYGNLKTIVLQGKVNSQGQILNEIGATIEVDRGCVNDDREQYCGEGLHAGSWDYARGWGQKTVLVKIDPRDVVSVPKDCNCQKMRVCKYQVIKEVNSELEDVIYGAERIVTVQDVEDAIVHCGKDYDELVQYLGECSSDLVRFVLSNDEAEQFAEDVQKYNDGKKKAVLDFYHSFKWRHNTDNLLRIANASSGKWFQFSKKELEGYLS